MIIADGKKETELQIAQWFLTVVPFHTADTNYQGDGQGKLAL